MLSASKCKTSLKRPLHFELAGGCDGCLDQVGESAPIASIASLSLATILRRCQASRHGAGRPSRNAAVWVSESIALIAPADEQWIGRDEHSRQRARDRARQSHPERRHGSQRSARPSQFTSALDKFFIASCAIRLQSETGASIGPCNLWFQTAEI